MSRYTISGPAQRDLLQIRDNIAQRSRSSALCVIREFRAMFRIIAAHPGIGHTRPELENDALRVTSLYSYLIIYKPGASPVCIVRAIHGARDLERFSGLD